jgi:tight adherence protein B
MSEAVLVAGLLALSCLALGVASSRASRERILEWLGEARSPRRGVIDRFFRVLPRRRLMAGSAGVAGAAFGLLVAGPPGGLAGLVGVALAPRVRRLRRARSELDLTESQLTGAVTAIAAGLRAGQSVSQALRFAASEAGQPLAAELREVVGREDFGVPLEESIARWAETSPGQEVRILAAVLRIRVGEGLPAVLDEVARTLRHRRTARREIASLTAQARLSGWILGLLPIGFFLFLSVVSRNDMEAALGSPAGLASITGGLVLETGGALWIRKLLRVAT